jgi:hypothetical protein
MDHQRELLRHAVATVAYRGGKAVRDVPEGFGHFKAVDSIRTPVQLLSHISDLYDWALSLAKGAQEWQAAEPAAWEEEVARFFQTLERFDAYLASDEPIHAPAAQLFQGPIADSLAHVGQIIMLRRVSGKPMRSENYARADIVAGRVGREQTPPRREFD